MKSLTILRHAKSGWDVPVDRDFDRPINTVGQSEALAVGQNWSRTAFRVDYVLASPALRVVETLGIFMSAAGIETVEPHWDLRIYLASSAILYDIVRELDEEDIEHLLLAGHNPGLEDLFLSLIPDSDPLRALTALKFPTATIARIELDIGKWTGLADNIGRIAFFQQPHNSDSSP